MARLGVRARSVGRISGHGSGTRARALLALIALTVLVPAVAAGGPAASAPFPAEGPALAGGGRFRAVLADAIAEEIRGAAGSGSVASVLRAVGNAADLTTEPPTGAGTQPDLSSGPPLGEPLAALVASARSAEAVVEQAASRVPAQRLAEALRLAEGLDPHDRAGLRRAAVLTRGYDLPGVAGAAAGILVATDALIAAHRGGESPPVAAGTPDGEGCDVADQPPVLCVAGGGPTTHTGEYLVTVDLGGDDTYRNSAGGASCLSGGADALRCVSVVVDLGGDDMYEPPTSINCGFAVCAQGTGAVGIGVLVDAAGNDRYSAHGIAEDRPDGDCSSSKACGRLDVQGVGVLGVGVLADLAGSDAYRAAFPHVARGSDGVEAAEFTLAQGSAVIGEGLLWDDEGNDDYIISGHATGYPDPAHQFVPWSPLGISSFSGQGVAAEGPGFLVDSAGDDRIAVEVVPAPGSEAPSERAPWGQGGSATIAAQGFATIIAHETVTGGLILGSGNAEVMQELRVRHGTPAGATGQGMGLFGGAHGLVDDSGGDDLYRLASITEATMEVRCDCEEAVLSFDDNAEPFTDHHGFGRAFVVGQGGPLGGIHDRGGNDRYEAVAHTDWRLVAANERPGGAARAGVLWVGTAWVAAQAVQPGRLQDDSGDDRYLIDARRSVTATARAAPTQPGGAGDEEAWAFPSPVIVSGQGVGPFRTAPLMDSGGRDSYEARVAGSGTADPDPGGHASDGRTQVVAQGTNGTLSDTDAGQADAFRADSPYVFNTCVGRYGEAPGWVSGPILRGGDCSPTWGTVTATSTLLAPDEPRLAFGDIQPAGSSAYPALEVEVRLTDAAGAPLAGRRVIVVPEHGWTDPDPLINLQFEWVDATASSTELVTDEGGVARGILATRKVNCERADCHGLTGDFRLRAFYYGQAGEHRPATAVSATMQDA